MLINNFNDLQIPEYVIIGAGPAGTTLADQLSQANKTVLLLEGGGEEISEINQNRYKGKVIGDKYFDLDVTRLRYFGGSSNHWGGNCAPLDETDFTEWPINKKDLDKYNSKAKKILNINEKFQKYENSIFKSFKLSSILESDVNFKEKYLDQFKKDKNIFLMLNANLIQINSDKENNYVQSLLIKKDKISKNLIVTKDTKIILSCGGLENSRILLWSKIKSQNNFLQGLPIGRYWMEHPSGEIAQFLGEENKIKKVFGNRKNFFLVPSKTFIENENLNNIRFNFMFWKKINDKSISHYIKDLVCVAPNLGKKIIEKISENIVHCVSVVKFSSEQKPDFNNCVKLSKTEYDDLGIPKIELHWNISDDVFITLKKSLEKLGEETINLNIGRIGIDKYVYEKSFKESNDIFGNHHHMGGTIMSSNVRKGVVDKNLKVENTNNLYVLGSSVFSSGGHFNPTFTIVQLALRLANHLKNTI